MFTTAQSKKVFKPHLMLQSIQASRALAALMVVLFHLGLVIEKYFGASPVSVPWGRAGLDFFFVLSGFIIATAHWEDIAKPERLGGYIWKRLVRIYPIYWIIFLTTLAGAYRLVELSFSDVIQALLLTSIGGIPLLVVACTLQWEIVFYAIFGALIVHPAMALVLVGMVLWLLPASVTFLLLFLAGVMCAWIDRRQIGLHWPTISFAGVFVFAGACVFETVRGSQPTIIYGLGAAMLVLGLVRGERAGKTIGAQPLLQLLGNASYCIYLVHYPFISFVCKTAIAIGLRGERWNVVVYGLALISALLTGVLLHLFLEKPMLLWLNSKVKKGLPARGFD